MLSKRSINETLSRSTSGFVDLVVGESSFGSPDKTMFARTALGDEHNPKYAIVQTDVYQLFKLCI